EEMSHDRVRGGMAGVDPNGLSHFGERLLSAPQKHRGRTKREMSKWGPTLERHRMGCEFMRYFKIVVVILAPTVLHGMKHRVGEQRVSLRIFRVRLDRSA